MRISADRRKRRSATISPAKTRGHGIDFQLLETSRALIILRSGAGAHACARDDYNLVKIA